MSHKRENLESAFEQKDQRWSVIKKFRQEASFWRKLLSEEKDPCVRKDAKVELAAAEAAITRNLQELNELLKYLAS